MVGLMGVVALVFWILKCSLTILLAVRISTFHIEMSKYIAWSSTKFVVRIAGVLFQLFFFFRITPLFGYRESIRKRRISYMLLPCIMLSQLAVFINSVIDTYSYVIEDFVQCADLRGIMLIVYIVGNPLHLGFCLHVFFHLVIINNNLRQLTTRQQSRPTSPIIRNDSYVDNVRKTQVEKLLDSGIKYRTV